MVNPEVAIPLVVLITASAGVLFRFFQHRERMAELNGGGGKLAASTERLERLEQAVESIAIEVERVGEGQRYLTRVLEDRPPPPR